MLPSVPPSKAGLGPQGGHGPQSSERPLCPGVSGPNPEMVAVDTLEAVRQLAQDGMFNPAVLVFASDTNPGGSRKGANLGTQEEALCRQSTLRPAQEQLTYPIPLMGVAYVPQVQGLLLGPAIGACWRLNFSLDS